MRSLIDFSLNYRLLIVVGWVLIAAIGLRSLKQLPIDAVPDVTNVQVQVLTNAPGLPPEDVERFITFPVETAMSGLPKVEELRSVSKFGLSVVTVVFHEGTGIYWARQLVGERLTEAKEAIPQSYGTPEMGPISTGLGEIYQFEVHGEGHTPMELRTILDWQINYQLRTVPGVVEVNAFGGELKTYQVTLDPDRLTAYRLTVNDVLETIESNNHNAGGGYLAHQGEQYLIRGEGLIQSQEDLANLVVKHRAEDGTPVLIRDVAEIEFAPMIRQGAVTRDGKGETVIGIVMMLMGENSRVVSQNVHAKVQEIQKSLPEGVTIETFYDRTELVNRTIATVAKNLIEGGLLVVLVLLLLLGNLRASLIVAAAIPLSMLVAFTAMNAFGISGNLMSLGALDFGLIVDGSVVMIENVMRYLRAHRDEDAPVLEKVRKACLQVAKPVTFAVGIIILVYVPILALRGIEGKMFQPMALTVIFALAGSLLCSLTLMPVLASFWLTKATEKEPWLYRTVKRIYRPSLEKSLKRPKTVFFTALALFLASLAMVPSLGTEFMPQLDEGAIAMQIWRQPSISLEKSNEVSVAAEAVLMEKFPEVTSVISKTGRAEIATDPMGVEISDTFILLKPRREWRFKTKEALIATIDEALESQIPGAIFSYSQPIQLRVSELISGVRSDVAIKIYGDDLALLKAKADEVVAIASKVEGAADVKAEQITGLPTLRIRLDRAAMARYGLHADDVLGLVETIGGKPVGTVAEGQKRFDIQVRLVPEARHSVAQIGALLVAPPENPALQVPLSQVADIAVEEGPAQISRDQVSRRVSVEANVRGRDLGSFVDEVQARLDETLELPSGWYLQWGGQFENLNAAVARLQILVPLVLLLIFAMLYTMFQSGRLASLIYLNIPMALTGGILALAMRGYPLSVSAGVGFIALFGVAVLNGVVLVAYIAEHQSAGETGLEAVQHAALARLRPVFMTAMVASLGFVPMALASGAGAEVQRPLATVVIGGLVTSTLLTLLVIPAVYRWFGQNPSAEGQ